MLLANSLGLVADTVIGGDTLQYITDTGRLYRQMAVQQYGDRNWLGGTMSDLYTDAEHATRGGGVALVYPWVSVATLDSTALDSAALAGAYGSLLRDALALYGSDVAGDAAAYDSVDVSERGVYAFASWWDGTVAILDSAVSPAGQRKIYY